VRVRAGAQELGRLPWLLAFFLRSRFWRARFDMRPSSHVGRPRRARWLDDRHAGQREPRAAGVDALEPPGGPHGPARDVRGPSAAHRRRVAAAGRPVVRGLPAVGARDEPAGDEAVPLHGAEPPDDDGDRPPRGHGGQRARREPGAAAAAGDGGHRPAPRGPAAVAPRTVGAPRGGAGARPADAGGLRSG
jgi:hypothetical protein